MANPTKTRRSVATASRGSSPVTRYSHHLRATCEGGGRIAGLTCAARQTISQTASAAAITAMERNALI